MKFYSDYFWQDGIPRGIGAPNGVMQYKIVMDPYRKHISVEQYDRELFCGVVYDSSLLDFRNLKPERQVVWHKSMVNESPAESLSLIRDHNDRALYYENYLFERHLCRECQVRTVHGIPISRQRMLYKFLGDSVNAVVLLDRLDHPVMYKVYTADEQTGDFQEVLEESWALAESPSWLTKYVPVPARGHGARR